MIDLDGYAVGDLREALARYTPPNVPRSPWVMKRDELIACINAEDCPKETQEAIQRHLAPCRRRLKRYSRPSTERDAEGRPINTSALPPEKFARGW